MRVLFAFPSFHGHLNPSLPVAQSLVAKGHEVHYFSFEDVRDKIEKTSAIFHSAVSEQPEYYAGRHMNGPLGVLEGIFEELSLDATSFLSQLQTLNIALELQLPGAIRFLEELKPDVVVYDALVRSRDMQVAAKVLGIRAVGLLSIAGPGAWLGHSPATLLPLTLADADRLVASFEPHVQATERLNSTYGLSLAAGLPQPTGKLDMFGGNVVLVSTSVDLQDPLPAELQASYEDDGAVFSYVGPLLAEPSLTLEMLGPDPVLSQVRAARAAGRPIVLVSMGTLLVSNHKLNGWNGRSGGARSLSGREICQAAWGGAFDAFGSSTSNGDTTLILVSVGMQNNPLGDLSLPSNAICLQTLPQVEILQECVSVFLTHGGQNSFTEAMRYSTPVVICPGFGDQVVNGGKAISLGVGLKVDRPVVDAGDEARAALQYRCDVCSALREVHSDESFRAAAGRCADGLRATGGVPRAVELILGIDAPPTSFCFSRQQSGLAGGA